MKIKFSLLCLCFFLFIASFSQTVCGAWIIPPNQKQSLDFRVSVADQLHITHLRAQVIVDDGKIPDILSTNYKLVLNINTSVPAVYGPQPFIKDTILFKKQLQTHLASICLYGKPVFVVPENEEANNVYHSGPALDYINELKATIPIVHSFGIQITNAGLTQPGLTYIVYKDLLARGLNGDAQQYASKTGLMVNNKRTIERGAFTDSLLNAYRTLNLDKINFHWYQKNKDTWALGLTMDYLIRRTGKGLVSNEAGQYDTDPQTVTCTVNEFRKHSSTLLIWFSGDGGTGKAVALQNNDKTLRPSGVAYRDAQGW